MNNGADAAEEIDDAWVTSGTTTKEVELYAIGILVDGKTPSELATALGFTVTAGAAAGADGNGLTEFNKAWDNAAFKKFLNDANQEWADLKFKVKIVKSTEYAKL